MISQENIDKLQRLSELAASVPCNQGEHFVLFHFGSGDLTWGNVEFMLFWKRECGEVRFKNLDEAIAAVEEVIKTVKEGRG